MPVTEQNKTPSLTMAEFQAVRFLVTDVQFAPVHNGKCEILVRFNHLSEPLRIAYPNGNHMFFGDAEFAKSLLEEHGWDCNNNQFKAIK